MDVARLISQYNEDDISIGTLGSHSALQILHGTKKEGFRAVLIATEERASFYREFPNLADEIIVLDSWKEVCREEVVQKLVELNTILVPHGSMVEYVGPECAMNLKVPLFGSRRIIAVEADPRRKMDLLRAAGIPVPREFSPEENFDDLVIVKLPGAKGGKGYFIAKGREEVARRLEELGVRDAIVQEYVIGVRAYYHYFYSPILNRLEIMGMDIRYETNADALGRLPREAEVEPSFVVVGNIPVVLRESLLPKVLEYGRRFFEATKSVENGGIAGPFYLESIIKDDLSIVVFEFSGRIVAGTNLFLTGSPYSWLYWDEPMSVGRRIAREVRLALKQGRLKEVVR